MNKIIVVSLVANSADIIESFVRYSLTFADEMILLDHDSADATPKILEKLTAEGLPIHWRPHVRTELAHDLIMAALVHEAVDKYRADIVLPLDADEFLVGSAAPRKLLQQLDVDTIYQIHLWTYELLEPDLEPDKFLLARSCHRAKNGSSPKVFLGARIIQKLPLMLAQGCHYAYWEEDGQRNRLSAISLAEQLHLAHFQWRGTEQIRSKVINGWISNVARYSQHTIRCAYWKTHFNALLRGERLAVGLRPQEIEKVPSLAIPVDIELRYTTAQPADALQNLMVLSERLAEDYCEEKSQQSHKLVSILLLTGNDFGLFRKSLMSAFDQTYPWKEILIGETEEKLSPELQEYLMSYQGKVPLRYIQPVKKGDFSELAMLLGKQAAGAYIQWILPGDVLLPDKIQQMAASLENDDELALLLADPLNVAEIPAASGRLGYLQMAGKEQFLAYPGIYIREAILKHSMLPAGGLSGGLFRRRVMEDSHWLSDYYLNGIFWEFMMWYYLFNWSLVGIFAEPALKRHWPAETPARVLYRQMEWLSLLQMAQQYPELQLACQEGLRTLLGKQAGLRPYIGGQQPDLIAQYEHVLTEAGKLVESSDSAAGGKA